MSASILQAMPVLGSAIAGLVLLTILLSLYSSFRRHRIGLRLLQQQVETARETALRLRTEWERSRALTELSWSGFRKFKIDRKVYEDGTGNICSFYLAPHDGKSLPPFKPGQFLTFQLNIPDLGATQRKPTIRCYSLSDSYKPEYYRVTIKKIPPPPDKPDLPPGKGSNFFHSQIGEGDILDVKAPTGDFFLDTTKHTPVVLIGGGVGITPVLSMLNTIVESGSQRETWFFLGIRNRAEHIMQEHLARIAREYENVHINVCYSNPGAQELLGKDYQHAERVSADLFKRVLPSNNYQFYICGPPPMMASLVEGLREWGVPEDDIKFEAFGPASVKKVAQPPATALTAPSGVETTVTFGRSGKTAIWNPTASSLLDFAEANGVVVDSGCRVGNCQTCLTAIKEGDVSYIHEPNPKPQSGTCLVCISVPKGNVVLDV
ncbi:MAG: 2Fe-2S iron-sulfur cluster binding domain-containing protein [candidate division Zixibacteria bacterium]|nr:2Fe-2S iron-sulfur cluster binding domain-containing protein [candidate division Zixibacteria bacterium]